MLHREDRAISGDGDDDDDDGDGANEKVYAIAREYARDVTNVSAAT